MKLGLAAQLAEIEQALKAVPIDSCHMLRSFNIKLGLAYLKMRTATELTVNEKHPQNSPLIG